MHSAASSGALDRQPKTMKDLSFSPGCKDAQLGGPCHCFSGSAIPTNTFKAASAFFSWPHSGCCSSCIQGKAEPFFICKAEASLPTSALISLGVRSTFPEVYVLFFAVCCLHTLPPEESEASHVTQRIFLRQSSCLCPLSRLKTIAFLVQISRRCWASKNLENEENKLKAKGS